MKQCYSHFLLPVIKKTTLLFIAFLGATGVSFGQVYWASLSGPAEAPPNNSPGTGSALVTIDPVANTMRVQANFSGLVAGVTAAHIHGPTAVAGTGTASVATTLPTFPGFPSGVTAGSYDQTFNMLLNTSYSNGFINNNGGTPASAFAALRAAIAAGKTYLNIHSTTFPGGEIRGFLTACPSINVTIPDAFALPSGVLANTIYPAYAPASSLSLASDVSGGIAPYSYSWSNGASTSSITVSPVATSTYSLSVRDQNGCTGSASKTVNVVDVSGGNKNDKINVCHNGNSITIAGSAVASHLAHGDMLGSCDASSRSVQPMHLDENLSIRILSNPSPHHFDIQINTHSAGNIRVAVFDNLGRSMETKILAPANQALRLGVTYKPGIYMVEVVQGSERKTFRLVKMK